jgi:hypothetical protein
MQMAVISRKTNRSAGWGLAVMMALAVLITPLDVLGAWAGQAGLSRAQEQRVADVVRMKNDFVRRVLERNGIPYRLNSSGTAVQLRIDDRWQPVDKTEIVPVLRDDNRGGQVVIHEIYFYTGSGVYRLVSELTVR